MNALTMFRLNKDGKWDFLTEVKDHENTIAEVEIHPCYLILKDESGRVKLSFRDGENESLVDLAILGAKTLWMEGEKVCDSSKFNTVFKAFH